MQKKITVKKLLLRTGAILLAVIIVADLVTRLVGLNFIAPFFLAHLYEVRNVVSEPSPDGQVIAVTYDFYGGATSTDGAEVTLRSKSEKFDIWKNTTVFAMEEIKNVKIAWTGNRELTIYHEPGVIDTQLSVWKDVHIRYSEK